MSNAALNKINQTHSLFKKIIGPLKHLLGLSFGYMIVFKNGSYYKIIEDMECLQEFITKVNKSSIFCDRNITDYFDGDYHITLWPKTPTSTAMEVYYKNNMWNGITISRVSKSYTELYWFAGGVDKTNLQKFFMKNKPVLLEFIHYFDMHKNALHLPTENISEELFQFHQGFEINLLKSERMQEDVYPVKKLLKSLRSNSIAINFTLKTKLSPRETEILSIICHGFTAKIVAQKLNISPKTVQHHLENIKLKTGLRFKTDLIKFYEYFFHKIT